MLVSDRRRFPEPAPGEVFSPAEWKVLTRALSLGIGAVQLREKDLDGGPLFARAQLLCELCARFEVPLLVNGRVDITCAVGAAGVHLPAGGLTVSDAREGLPAGALVGASVHGVADLPRAAGADYVIFGPIYETSNKPGYGPAQRAQGMAAFAAQASMPVLGIGGIRPENCHEICAAGAAGVAVMGAILENPEIVPRFYETRIA